MPNPQQPELRRSERVPALDPDATEARLTAERSTRESTDPRAPVPEEQRPGHRPADEQDKPDMDAFADRLGVVPDDEEPEDAPRVEEPEARRAPTGQRGRRRWSPIGLALVGPVTGYVAVKAVFRALRAVRR